MSLGVGYSSHNPNKNSLNSPVNKSKPPGRFKFIDGLRGPAALWVVPLKSFLSPKVF